MPAVAAAPTRDRPRVAGRTDRRATGAGVVTCTFGHSLEDRDSESYPAQLQSKLGEKYSVVNFGVSGVSASSGNTAWYGHTEQFRLALQFHPDVIVLMLGTNDCMPHITKLNNFEQSLKDMIETLTSCDNDSESSSSINAPVLLLCRPAPLYLEGFESEYTHMLEQLDRVAANTSSVSTLIDIYAVLKDKKHLFPDKVRPDLEGCGIIAQAVYEAVITWYSTTGSNSRNTVQ